LNHLVAVAAWQAILVANFAKTDFAANGTLRCDSFGEQLGALADVGLTRWRVHSAKIVFDSQ
jgi:hypothetical protein